MIHYTFNKPTNVMHKKVNLWLPWQQLDGLNDSFRNMFYRHTETWFVMCLLQFRCYEYMYIYGKVMLQPTYITTSFRTVRRETVDYADSPLFICHWYLFNTKKKYKIVSIMYKVSVLCTHAFIR